MAPQKSLIIILSVCLLSLSGSATSTPKSLAPEELAAQLCKNVGGDAATAKKDMCIKALSHPEALSDKEAKQLMSVVMKAAEAGSDEERKQLIYVYMQAAALEAHTALNNITEMAKKPCPPAKLKALQKCKEVFSNLVVSYDMVSKLVFEDTFSAAYDVHNLSGGANDCISAMKAANLQAPHIEIANHSLQEVSNWVFELTRTFLS
ncbi:Pectinesterase inhibitor [Corchorus capsularis]|uniref:Pectinesterase inhibitor n=1 Tax=Corchorus capsularis TaxID=210143 RepID=A0A1R3KWP3_COCAP|nr:Pectinesterase inhibitor [Corchorus capsularis]